MTCKTLTISLLLLFSTPVLALKNDTNAPININSTNQRVEMQSNTITFTGDVVIKQGSISIYADRVEVTRPNGEEGYEVITAFGKPVKFSQKQDNGKLVNGNSQKLRYNRQNKTLELTGKAFLKQQDSSINSERITYYTEEQRVEANGGRVSTVIVPAQLQEKNR